MSYSIFRVQGIKTTGDLRGIGKHNADRVSYTNHDIDRAKSSENIELVKCEDTYLKRFNEITSEMKIDHEKRMKSMRSDRRKSFDQAINSAKNDVACEFLFTSDEEFFQNKSKEEIESWAKQSLEFLEKDIGITKDKIIHAAVHMDERTPHLHVVAVPLIKAYDGRRKADTWQISRKKFIKTKEDLANLQDRYHQRMNEHGHKLERGTTKDIKHATVQGFKEQTKYHENEVVQALKKADHAKELANKLVADVRHISKLDKIPVHQEIVWERQVFKKVEKVTGRVILEPKDYQVIKTLAKASDVLKTQNKKLIGDNNLLNKDKINLKEKVEHLTKENQQLKTENLELKTENDFLKKTLERVKEFYKEKVPQLANMVGYMKATVLDKMGKKLLKRHFVDDSERNGVQKFFSDKQEQKKNKELKVKSRNRDQDYGMER
ncbi:MobV family relaxase [Bacillus cereus group sp. N21]|uniref:MobV family relaxase n=1 Tax=Bacillus cereus group sp. N21 TaxID=2794591 RepID=UPI0018F50B3C|nr:MobV family relaxase [Bacillus cereus group sp. N21]MBJ8031636.1 plasmid recombination protein [Bacillus cereus group sp. N21]